MSLVERMERMVDSLCREIRPDVDLIHIELDGWELILRRTPICVPSEATHLVITGRQGQ